MQKASQPQAMQPATAKKSTTSILPGNPNHTLTLPEHDTASEIYNPRQNVPVDVFIPNKLNVIPKPGQTKRSIIEAIETMTEWEYIFCKNRQIGEHVPDVEVIVKSSVVEGKQFTFVRFQELGATATV